VPPRGAADGHVATYKAWSAYPLEQEAFHREAYIAWQNDRLEKWTEVPLSTTKDKEQIKSMKKSRTAAIRTARRELRPTTDHHTEELNEEFDPLTPDWIASNMLDQREEAIYLAKQAFDLGSTGLLYYTWADGKCLRKQIFSFAQFRELFDRWRGEVPGLTCLTCDERLYFRFGELWCEKTRAAIFTLESQRSIETLALLAKTFLRGDNLAHLRLQDHGGGRWYDIKDWSEANNLVRSKGIVYADVWCSVCKGPLGLSFTRPECECANRDIDNLKGQAYSEKQSLLQQIKDGLRTIFQGQIGNGAVFGVIANDTSDEGEAEVKEDLLSCEQYTRQEIDLLQLAPSTKEQFERWLVSLGICKGYSKISAET
jgi:hypothetical protein